MRCGAQLGGEGLGLSGSAETAKREDVQGGALGGKLALGELTLLLGDERQSARGVAVAVGGVGGVQRGELLFEGGRRRFTSRGAG